MNQTVKDYIDHSVLCWLATSSEDNMPNVSPKEIFTYYNDEIVIANIASPQTVKNIQQNEKVCLSFIHIFIQKGFQIKGIATILEKTHKTYKAKEAKLIEMTQDQFPFSNIINIRVESIKDIWAPSYLLYPDTIEDRQIENAILAYNKMLTSTTKYMINFVKHED